MNYGSCKCCGKLIKFDNLSLCKDCEAKYLHAVKDYIYDNGIKTPEEINKATNVPIRVIQYFLNNNYLSKIDMNNEVVKYVEDEEKLRQIAILEALKGSFSQNEEEKKECITGEMHFLGRKR